MHFDRNGLSMTKVFRENSVFRKESLCFFLFFVVGLSWFFSLWEKFLLLIYQLKANPFSLITFFFYILLINNTVTTPMCQLLAVPWSSVLIIFSLLRKARKGENAEKNKNDSRKDINYVLSFLSFILFKHPLPLFSNLTC